MLPRHCRRIGLATLLVFAFAEQPRAQEKNTTPEFDFGRGIYNAAKAKPVSASSENPKNAVAHATDGLSTTSWKPKADENFPHTIRVNLRRELDAKAIIFQWDAATAVQFKLDGSTNGTDWTPVLDATGNEDSGLVTRHKVDTKKTQYLRLTITGATDEKLPGLSEWAVYEDPAKIPKPVQDAAKGILPKAKPQEEKKPDPEPVPDKKPKPEPEKKNGKRPPPSDVTVTRKLVAPESDDPILKNIRLPENYTATVFAKIQAPDFVKATPAGALFVSSGLGKIQKIIDTDRDGVADETHDFIPQITSPRGLEWDGEWLYVVHPPHLSAWRDTDGDHVADENRRLVTDLSFSADHRSLDRSANGITLGIDGWLYLAIGDHGIFQATATADGKTFTHRGGAIARIRPDGTGLHLFSRGIRTVHDIALSPSLAAFGRDSTNHTGHWHTALHQFTGLDNHGYPAQFKHFAEETVPPLSIHKTGVSTGALWLAEPGFPQSETDVALTCDLAENVIFRHELQPHGAGHTQKARHLLFKIPQPTDIDADATDRLFVSSSKTGTIVSITPKNREPKKAPKFSQEPTEKLLTRLTSQSHLIRLHAQRELLRRETPPPLADLKKIVSRTNPVASRTNPVRSQTDPVGSLAAFYTIAQLADPAAFSYLIDVAKNPDSKFRSHAFRALGDHSKTTDHEIFKTLPNIKDPKTALEAIVAMTRTRTRESNLVRGIVPHSIHRDGLISHTAIEALVELDAQRTCLAVIADKERQHLWLGSLRALSRLNSMTVVNGITGRLKATENPLPKNAGLKTLARLFNRPGEWSGESWGAQPDRDGPYYLRSSWSGSAAIGSYLREALRKATNKDFLLGEIARNHVQLDDMRSILKLTAKKPEMEESTVAMILKRAEPPADAIPFLIFLASHPERDGNLRLKAALSLAKSKDTLALDTALETLASASEIKASDRFRGQLQKAIYRNATLKNRYTEIIEHGFSPNDSLGKLAWQLLQKWSTSDGCSPAMKRDITAAFSKAKSHATISLRLPEVE